MPVWVRTVLVVAAVAIAAGLVWSLVLIVADSQASPADPGATGEMHAQRVVEGMCLEEVGPDGAVADTYVVDCRDAHRAEVFATAVIPLEVYPGDEALLDQSLEACTDRAQRADVDDWVAWIPSADSWVRGDRTVTCIAVSEEPTRGSVIPRDPDDPAQDVGVDA